VRVRERRDERGLVVEDSGERLAGVRGPQPRELRERGRVERVRLDPLDSERHEPRSELPPALSVKVTARICDGSNAPLRTWHAMRCVIVLVLPVPAPARIATGPRSASAASRWASFSPARTVSRSATEPTLAFGPDGPGGFRIGS
jgi:hypothetical protein